MLGTHRAHHSTSANQALTKLIVATRTVGAVTALSRRAFRHGGAAAVVLVILVAGLLAGTGWLYVLRGLHWLNVGPRIGDALPLLQLASFDAQPLLRVLVAWVLAGALTGVALSQVAPRRRVGPAFAVALIALLLAAQESYALTRNLTFSSTVFSHAPGLGPVLEAVAFALGCWLPRPINRGDRPRTGGRSLASVLTGFSDRGVSGGERGDAGQHDRDREPVRQARLRARA
jgi:hypothetical protein